MSENVTHTLFGWYRADFLLAIWGKLIIGVASPPAQNSKAAQDFF